MKFVDQVSKGISNQTLVINFAHLLSFPSSFITELEASLLSKSLTTKEHKLLLSLSHHFLSKIFPIEDMREFLICFPINSKQDITAFSETCLSFIKTMEEINKFPKNLIINKSELSEKPKLVTVLRV